MKRVLSLCLIFALSLGVYWIRSQPKKGDLSGKVALCMDEGQGAQAIAACDLLLAVPDLAPATRGYFLFQKAYALDIGREDEAALAAYS